MSTAITLFAAINPSYLTKKFDGTFGLSYAGQHAGLRDMVEGRFHNNLTKAREERCALSHAECLHR